ncbi:MAG: GNAT family N-acetyltransferase [Selenomonadaceae bacterium]|nr:GNAT family N-acetyltransferase [Selenomonadaceae bacterium]
MTVELVPTLDEENFIDNLQEAFRQADGTEKFRREDLPKIFKRSNATLLDILADKEIVGGAVLIINVETQRNKLSLFFVKEDFRNQGLGFAAWQAIEKFFPDTKVWYTSTSWLDRRNLHFYLNKCGFVAFSIYGKEDFYLAMEKVMR